MRWLCCFFFGVSICRFKVVGEYVSFLIYNCNYTSTHTPASLRRSVLFSFYGYVLVFLTIYSVVVGIVRDRVVGWMFYYVIFGGYRRSPMSILVVCSPGGVIMSTVVCLRGRYLLAICAGMIGYTCIRR